MIKSKTAMTPHQFVLCIIAGIATTAVASGSGAEPLAWQSSRASGVAAGVATSYVLEDEQREDASPGITITLTPSVRYIFSSDIDGAGNNEYNVWRAGIDASFAIPVSETSRFIVDTDYEFSSYNFDAPNSFLTPLGSPGSADGPFEDIHILDLRGTLWVSANETDSWFIGGGARFAGMADVDLSDSGTFSGYGGYKFKYCDALTLTLGAVVETQIEDDVRILPIINMDLDLGNNWQLHAVTARSAEIELSYMFDDQLRLGVGAGYEFRRFRLDDDAIHVAAVVEDTSIPLFARLTYQADKALQIHIEAGVEAAQEFEVSDRNGNTQRKYESDAAGYIGASLKWSF